MKNPQQLLERIATLEKEKSALELKLSEQENYPTPALIPAGETIFKTIFEASRLGNKIIDSDLNIIEVNMALVTLLGYKHKQEVIGKRILEYVPDNRRSDWKLLQENLWENATPSFSLETCLIKKDGTLIWCQVTSILFLNQEDRFGYTIIEDITEQHNLRLQKEQFISVASHELKTPITSLKAMVQLMNRQLTAGAQITEKLTKLGQDSDRQVNRLIHLVDDLLSSTKLEHGQLSLNKAEFIFSTLLDGCCSQIHLNEKYHLTFKGDPNMRVFSDAHKIEQVLINLINNAIKYAPASQNINVQLEKIEGYAKISIIDQGNGIPAASIPMLFDRYYRVEQDNFSPGLGLGLYISAEIIKRHGGQIGVESTIGQGSSFWFTIPDRNPEEENI